RRRPLQEAARPRRPHLHWAGRDLWFGLAVLGKLRREHRRACGHRFVADRWRGGALAGTDLLRTGRRAAARGRRGALPRVFARRAARISHGIDHADRVFQPDSDRSGRLPPIRLGLGSATHTTGIASADIAGLAGAVRDLVHFLSIELLQRQDVRARQQPRQHLQIRGAADGRGGAAVFLPSGQLDRARLRAVRVFRNRRRGVRGRNHLRVSRIDTDRFCRGRGAQSAAHDPDRADPVGDAVYHHLCVAAGCVPRQRAGGDHCARLARHGQAVRVAVPRHRRRARRRLAGVPRRVRCDDLSQRLRQHLYECRTARGLWLGARRHVLPRFHTRRQKIRHPASGVVADVRAGDFLDAAVSLVVGDDQRGIGSLGVELCGRADHHRGLAPQRTGPAASVPRARLHRDRSAVVRDRRADRLLVGMENGLLAAGRTDRVVCRLRSVPRLAQRRSRHSRARRARFVVADRFLLVDDRALLARHFRRQGHRRFALGFGAGGGCRAGHIRVGCAQRCSVPAARVGRLIERRQQLSEAKMKKIRAAKILGCALCLFTSAGSAVHAQDARDAHARDAEHKPPKTTTPPPLQFHYMGPPAGGRVASVAGIPGDDATFYRGAASGGLWKSTDGGHTFAPIFDDQDTSAIGAIAVAPSDSSTVWVGTGERWFIRPSDIWGDGVYKSTDAGKTWKQMGLTNTGRIARIVVNPKDSNNVLVCAEGRGNSPQQERGIFRSTDGGKTWQQTLFVNANTGCSGLSIDPNHPDTLLAGTWQVTGRTWAELSGGPGSGVYLSHDNGRTWQHLTDGLPTPPLGKIDV